MPVLTVATRKGLFDFEKTPSGWRQTAHHFNADPVMATLCDPRNGDRYAALSLGHFGTKLHRAAGGGGDWQELPVPNYPAEDGSEATTLEHIWELVAAGPDQPDTIWAGTIPGGLFRSDDRGDSWHLIESLWNRPERAKWFGGGFDSAGIHSICIHPDNSDSMLVAISCGGVWATEDGGRSWAQVGKGLRADFLPPQQADELESQDPHRMVRCSEAPDHLWIQHHNGIFRSTDNARTWREIVDVTPSTFGFGVAVHPVNPEMAWFVPAKKDEFRIPVDARLVVTHTRNGGEDFEILNKGLPEVPVYDIVLRHALAIDGSGEILAFGSSTGNLWISEDGGKGWTSISHYLPPIYAVSFF